MVCGLGALAPRPTRPPAAHPRKTRSAPPPHRPFREKTRPASPKTPKLGCFQRAGRTFSRRYDNHSPAGRAFSHPNETSDTFARSFASTHETDNTFAHPQCRKIEHFVQAKVTAVSPHHENRAAKVSMVSARHSVAPKRQAMPLRNAITEVRPRPIIPHAIPTQPDPTSTRNPQNSNDQTSNHETHSRELHAKLLGQRGLAGQHTATSRAGVEGAGGTGGHGRASRRGAERSEDA